MVKMAKSSLLLTTLVSSLLLGSLGAQSQQEEQEDYFKKWLQEDVIYTITEEEKDVFNKLQTPEEKERFIEQFWFRRDPSPQTSYNEFKEEHYRRVQYSNDHFASGIPGWKTDRGMIYIKNGEPDRIESHPSGGHYSMELVDLNELIENITVSQSLNKKITFNTKFDSDLFL